MADRATDKIAVDKPECIRVRSHAFLGFIALHVRYLFLVIHTDHGLTILVFLKGLALYRALLRQCSPSAGSAPWIIQARIRMKQRFRKYKKLQSPTQTANALRAGYEVYLSTVCVQIPELEANGLRC